MKLAATIRVRRILAAAVLVLAAAGLAAAPGAHADNPHGGHWTAMVGLAVTAAAAALRLRLPTAATPTT